MRIGKGHSLRRVVEPVCPTRLTVHGALCLLTKCKGERSRKYKSHRYRQTPSLSDIPRHQTRDHNHDTGNYLRRHAGGTNRGLVLISAATTHGSEQQAGLAVRHLGTALPRTNNIQIDSLKTVARDENGRTESNP